MKVFRKEKSSEAIMVLETDDVISQEIIKEIQNMPNIVNTNYLNPV